MMPLGQFSHEPSESGALAARISSRSGIGRLVLLLAAVLLCGCTSWREYRANGWKVGPNYRKPAAPVADAWIDSDDPRVKLGEPELCHWWTVLNDDDLNHLIFHVYNQNLDLRTAALRVLESQAQRAIAVGGLFPGNSATATTTSTNPLLGATGGGLISSAQTQTMEGFYRRQQISKAQQNTSFFPFRALDQWGHSVSASWELDFWGRYRRQIESANATLDASIEDYDAVLVMLLAETADAYVQYRTAEQRLAYARKNAEAQGGSLSFAEERFRAGATNELDSLQAKSNLMRTQAAIPELEVNRRVANNRLCVLMGLPPHDLSPMFKPLQAMPSAPSEVAVDLPASLLLRRPDVRRSERQAASQSAQIGVAEANFYPHISIAGTMGYNAQMLNRLYTEPAFNGSIGPAFSWQILNYGRLLNNVRFQDARFKELAVQFQQTVLKANEEAENAMVTFLQAQEQVNYLNQSVDAASRSVDIVMLEYKFGKSDFNRVFNLQALLAQEQDRLAVAQSATVRGLIQLYKALGGGWQIRLGQPGMIEGSPDGELVIPPSPDSAPKPNEPPAPPEPPKLDKVDAAATLLPTVVSEPSGN